MRIPRSFRTTSFRLALLYAVLFAGSVLLLGGFVFWTVRLALEQQLATRVETESIALQAEFRSGGLQRLAALVRERMASRASPPLSYALLAATGERLAGTLPVGSAPPGWVDIEGGESVAGERTASAERFRALIVALADGARLAVAGDLGQIEEVEEAILGAFGSAAGIVLILGIAGGLVLSIGFLRRVDAVTRTAEAIIAGDLSRRIPTRGVDDDFDRLALTLNRMLDRIGDLMERLRQVSNDIAHDLRTPLSRLRQRLESLRGSLAAEPEREREVDAAVADTDAILDTFGALLRIAQIESGARRSGFRAVDLSAVFETVVEAFAPSAEDAGKSLEARVAKHVFVRGDRELLSQLLVNLVENAIRHTPEAARIEVDLSVTEEHAVGIVFDNGPGVPERERERIFRRFYRLENSRSSPGSGLGLSLVAAVAALHNARIEVQDNRPGLRVTLHFPLAESA